MRSGDIIAAIVVTLVALVAFSLWSRSDVRMRRGILEEDGRPGVLDSAIRSLAVAESTLFARRGRYATRVSELATAGIPTDVRIVSIAATDSTWGVRIEADVNGTRIGCLASGRRVSAGREESRLSFCDSRMRVESTHATLRVHSP